MILPVEAQPLLEVLSPAITAPTFARFVTPFGSAILCTGRRTVADLLHTAAPLTRGHSAIYRCVPSSAELLALGLACQPSRLVLALIPADRPVILVGDDTVDGHPGRKVYGKARPRVKGGRRPKPREGVVAARRRRKLSVGWYGGGSRRVKVVTATGHWYKTGDGLVPVRWVFVHDREGTDRDGYFYVTDPAMDPAAIVTYYAGRWDIECTFQESRAHLHSETPRGWCQRPVLRATPCLLGLDLVVTLLFGAMPESERTGRVEWPGKVGVTSSDTLGAVRLHVGSEGVFRQAGIGSGLTKLPEPVRELLCQALAPAA